MTYIIETYTDSKGREYYCMKSTETKVSDIKDGFPVYTILTISGCEGRSSNYGESYEQFMIRMALSGFIPELESKIWEDPGSKHGIRQEMFIIESGKRIL